ncbi:hypothetical protein JRO89_XS04G0104400 [Xanthoceras sorbifolium]|uniref:Uncharacterized protein n=1 Tax=Xanthoceras sorbifolium TaxID=99658 RepID=A0ABQ8I4R5_9ROSI|nr:hypothetical protein JRO89_XS04G0104400 [Xanthoceras sorbifolium]
MGRPPCCDKVGIKKGPWTPEEDIILVSYIQEHGPGNWRSVPTNTALDPHVTPDTSTTSHDQFVSKSFSDRKSLDFTNQASNLRLNQAAAASSYASSTENISRLLEGWMRSSPKSSNTNNSEHHDLLKGGSQDEKSSVVPQQYNNNNNDSVDNSVATTSLHCYRPKEEQEGGDLITNEEFISILSFENLNNVSWDKSTSDNSTTKGSQNSANEQNINATTMADQKKQRSDQSTTPPLSILEKWLLDESSAGQSNKGVDKKIDSPDKAVASSKGKAVTSSKPLSPVFELALASVPKLERTFELVLLVSFVPPSFKDILEPYLVDVPKPRVWFAVEVDSDESDEERLVRSKFVKDGLSSKGKDVGKSCGQVPRRVLVLQLLEMFLM